MLDLGYRFQIVCQRVAVISADATESGILYDFTDLAPTTQNRVGTLAGTWFLNGDVDELLLFDRVPSDSEIRALYEGLL